MASIAEVLAGERVAAKKFLAEAEQAAAGIDDIPTRVAILQARSLNGMFEADVDGLRKAATEGERLSRQVGDLYAQHMMLLNLGGAAPVAGDLATAQPLYEQAPPIAYPADHPIR